MTPEEFREHKDIKLPSANPLVKIEAKLAFLAQDKLLNASDRVLAAVLAYNFGSLRAKIQQQWEILERIQVAEGKIPSPIDFMVFMQRQAQEKQIGLGVIISEGFIAAPDREKPLQLRASPEFLQRFLVETSYLREGETIVDRARRIGEVTPISSNETKVSGLESVEYRENQHTREAAEIFDERALRKFLFLRSDDYDLRGIAAIVRTGGGKNPENHALIEAALIFDHTTPIWFISALMRSLQS